MPFDNDNDMGSPTESLCNTCKHANGDYPPTCKAYPNGIPLSIISGEVDHREPVRGDRGIQYERS